MDKNYLTPRGQKVPEKPNGQKLLEAAVLGIALGVAIGAIAHYLSQKNE